MFFFLFNSLRKAIIYHINIKVYAYLHKQIMKKKKWKQSSERYYLDGCERYVDNTKTRTMSQLVNRIALERIYSKGKWNCLQIMGSTCMLTWINCRLRFALDYILFATFAFKISKVHRRAFYYAMFQCSWKCLLGGRTILNLLLLFQFILA